MIDFYVLTSPNVQKIFLMLEELELPYRAIPVDVWKGDHFTPEFSAINPNRKIPVIVDHEGPGGKPSAMPSRPWIGKTGTGAVSSRARSAAAGGPGA